MRFNRSDSVSPFGRGGLNSYAFVKGDPVNYSDPSGHSPLSSLAKWVFGSAKYHSNARAVADELTRNVRFADPGMYVFDDFTKKGMRLNVVVHGAQSRVSLSAEKKLDLHQFTGEIDKVVNDYSSYDHARLLVCHSAEEAKGLLSVGEFFSNHTGLRTKAFYGQVRIAAGDLLGLETPNATQRYIGRNKNGVGHDFHRRHEIHKPLFSTEYRRTHFMPLQEVVVRGRR